MKKEKERLIQRLTMVRRHIQEWRDSVDQEAQARKLLINQHHAEKARLKGKCYPVEWAGCLTRHAEELTEIAQKSDIERQVLIKRQEQESDDLEFQLR